MSRIGEEQLDADVTDSRSTLAELSARRRLIEHLTAGHLDALEHFRLPRSPGRPLPSLHSQAVSLPPFLRRLPVERQSLSADGQGDLFSGAELDHQRLRPSSTHAAIRSILRHPGVYYRNLRPLQLLTELFRDLETRRLGPPGLALTVPVGQLAHSAELLKRAVTRLAGDESSLGQLEGSRAPNAEVLSIIQRLYYQQVERDTYAFDREVVEPGSDAFRELQSRLEYSLRRLHGLYGIRQAVCDIDDATWLDPDRFEELCGELASADEASQVRALTERTLHAELVSPVGIWLAQVAQEARRAAERPPRHRGEWSVSIFVAHQILWRCREQSLADLPTAFDSRFRVESHTPEHPYCLYWALAGQAAISTIGNEGQRNEVRERMRALILSAREAYHHLVANAASSPSEIDMFRLGYHTAVQLEHAHLFADGPISDRVDLSVARTAISVLREGLKHGAWAKRDRFWTEPRTGDAFGFTIELMTSLLIAAEPHPEIAACLEPCIAPSLAWLDRSKQILRPLDPDRPLSGAFAWATGLGSESMAPEAWATAESYSFLYLANRYYDRLVAQLTVREFGGRLLDSSSSAAGIVGLGQMPGAIARGGERKSITTGQVLAKQVLMPLEVSHAYFGRFDLASRADRKEMRRSGILFGPPGTGKTTYVERLAEALGWPLIVLGPYDFLQLGTDRVPEAARRIFDYLMELRDCVVLLDEMEEFVRSRSVTRHSEVTARAQSGAQRPLSGAETRALLTDSGIDNSTSESAVGFQQRLWTTVLLPLLQELHDRANVLYFVATNYFDRIDSAIARQGRFDVRLHALPPQAEVKVEACLVARLRDDLRLSENVSRELVERSVATLCNPSYLVVETKADGSQPWHRAVAVPDVKPSRRRKSPIEDLEVSRVDGTVVAAPMPIDIRFEYFTWSDTIALARRIARALPVAEVEASLTGKGPYRYESILLQCFREVVPTSFDWWPERDMLRWGFFDNQEPDDPEVLEWSGWPPREASRV